MEQLASVLWDAKRSSVNVARSLRNRLFRVPGPRQTSYAKSISLEFSGDYQVVYPGSTARYTPPDQDNSFLCDFLLEHAETINPEVFVASFPNGRFHAGGVVLSPDGLTVIRDLSVDFSKPFAEHFLLGQQLKRPHRVPGSVLFTGVAGAWSYYHWLLDELPRILIAPFDSFETLACSRTFSVQAEALQLLPMKTKRIISVDNGKGRNHFVADHLISPSYLAGTGEPRNYLVQTLQGFVEPLIDSTTRYPEKIYLTRRGSGRREVVDSGGLDEELARRGFTEIYLESMSWREQINAFYHAKEIVAAHGAGLANLVFCRNSPFVVELFNSHYAHWCFWKLASLVGATYMPVATPYGPVSHQGESIPSNIEIDRTDVRKIVHFLGES